MAKEKKTKPTDIHKQIQKIYKISQKITIDGDFEYLLHNPCVILNQLLLCTRP